MTTRRPSLYYGITLEEYRRIEPELTRPLTDPYMPTASIVDQRLGDIAHKHCYRPAVKSIPLEDQ